MAISLSKGQKISLVKDANGGNPLTKIIMGLGWDISPSAGTVDLDASCVLLDANKNEVDKVWFRNLHSSCGSVNHSGDNLTGAGDGDDEQIVVDLSRVPEKVTNIVFTVTSYRGQQFTVVDNAFVRLVDGTNDKELAKYNLSVGFPQTAIIMGRLYRHNGEWKFAALGEPANGKVVGDLVGVIKSLI